MFAGVNNDFYRKLARADFNVKGLGNWFDFHDLLAAAPRTKTDVYQ